MGLTEIKNQFQVNPDYSSGFMPSAFLGMRYADVMTHTWGNVPYPVNYVYDNYGRMTQMNTWRTGTGFDGATFPPGATGLEDSTSWTYQEATGLLLSKTDDNARSVNYTYTTGGKLLTRVWARTPVITTTYSYDPNTAELLNVNYSDTTPDVTFTYDRLGRPSTVVDGLGTRTFAYNAALAPLTETITGLYSKVITRTYATTGVIGRPTGFNTGAAYSNTWGYDTKGRLNSVNWTITGATAGSATYAYTANSDLLAARTLGTRVSTYTYETNRDLKSQVRNQVGATTVSQYAYVNDAVGRRTSVVNTGTGFTASAFSLWGYNNRNELTAANRYLGTNITVLTSPVPAETRAFTYDPIGNRTNMTVGTTPGTFTANNLNQYTIQTGPANTFIHDFDGNLSQITGTRNVVFTYDGENRLLSVQPVTPVTNNKRLEFVYDHQGRRVQKLIYNRSAGAAWVLQTTKRFVYEGFNMIEEQTVSAATKYYVYGLDLSQSLQGAGGVGGLLAKAEGSATHNYFYDANGNVSQMVNASGGAITARYEYDAYGNSILATGAQATSNPFRFSSKYFDTEFSLYYYGYRYYDPATGRWLNRDPLEEDGGVNLYGFIVNTPINYIDLFGLEGLPTWLLSRDNAYKIASKYIHGSFANELLKHYLWGNGEDFLLTTNDVLTKLKPIASLTQSKGFLKDIVAPNHADVFIDKKYSLSALDFSNPSGGLGQYIINVKIDVVCQNKDDWQAVGKASIAEKWDFDWNWNNLRKEWESKFKAKDVFRKKFPFINLGGRETRTALGSLLPGAPFIIKAENIPFKQSSQDSFILFGE